MADSFKILASLDISKSISQINSDIAKLQSQVNQLKITTEIDIAKSLNNIQAKINSIPSPTIKVNINPINADITNTISNGLKGIQAQASQTASAINNTIKSLTNLDNKFKKPISAITDNGIINAEKTIAKIKQHFSELGKVTIKGFYNDTETVDNLNKVAVKIKAITGETRTLNLELDKSGKKFYLASGTSDNSGIDKMILSAQKAQDKLNSLRTDLASTLKSIGTSFSDPNNAKAIIDDTHIKNLRIQYIKALRTIADLKNADSTTMNSMKSNAEKEIDTLKRMIKEYQNAEYVATSLRTKDLSTNKTIQSQELDKFISKISKNKAVINAMTSDIESLKMSLNGIKDSNSFTKFLNELDVAKSKASSLSAMYQTIGGYDKQLDKLAQNWQKQGIYTEKLKATIEGLKSSLSNVKTSDGLTVWINDFNSKIGSISQLPLKIAESRKQLNGIKQVWSEFQGKDKIISNVNKELGKMGSRLGNIKNDKAFAKWSEDLSKLNTQILGFINNLNKQVVAQNNINNIQAKISTLNPNKDSAEIARLNEKLQLEQKSLTNLKNQSNIYSNLISFEQQEQYITEKTSATRDKLLSSINAGVKGYKSSITSAINELNRLQKSSVFSNNSTNPVVEQTKQQITQLISKYQSLMSEMRGNITPSGFENIRNKLIELSNQFVQVTSTAKNFESQLKNNNSADKLAQKVALLTARIEAFKKVNSKSVKNFGSQYDSMLSELRNPNIDETAYNRINKQFQIMRQEIVATDKAGKSLFDLFKEKSKKFFGWFSLTYVFSLATRTLRNMISDVVALDKAMTNLKKVTDETESNYARFLKTASNQAQELHSTITDLVEQTATWAKLGYSLQDAQNLAKTSMIYSKVGEVENATAVSDLVTVMKAFNIVSSKSITIVDALNELGNNFATSAGDLGEGLTKSASALQVANNSFEQSIALLTGGSEITQNANEMGSALKVISMRIRGMKGDLEALGEEYENIEPISKIQTQILNLTKGKVNIFDDNGNFRSTYDILKDISEIYNDLSDPDKANLTEILFGKLRGNQGVALIQAFQSGQIQKAYETALNSAGSAQKEFDSWSKSIEAHVETFKSAFESLSNAVFENDFLKSLVDSGTKLVSILENIIDKIGIIPTILAGISTAKAFKYVGVFNSDIRNNYIQYGQTLISLKSITGDLTKQSALLALTVQNLTPKQQALALATKGVNQAQIAEILSLNGIEEKQIQQVLLDTAIIQKKKELTVATAKETIMAQGLNKVTAESIMRSAGIVASNETEVISKKKVSVATLETKLAQEGLSNTQIKAITAQLGLRTSTLTLSNYFKGLAVSAWSSVKAIGAFFATNPVGWVLLAGGTILGVTKLIKKYNEEQKQALQERKESALSAIDTLQSESSQVDSLIDKYTEYISTTSDLTTIKNELTDVQSQLNDVFGEEKSEIDLLNNSYAENIKLINEKKKAESEKFLRDNNQAYNDAKKFLDSESFAQTIYNNDGTYFTKISDDAIKLKALGSGTWSEKTKNSWQQIADSLGYNNFVLESGSNIAYIGGTPEQQIQTLEKFYDAYKKQIEGLTDKKYQDRLNAIGKVLSDTTQKYQDYTNIVEDIEKQQKFIEDVAFFEDENKNNLYKKLTDDIIELNQQFEQANSTASKLDLIDKINSAYDELQKLVAGNKIAKESVESLFNDFSSGINQYINSITSSADTYISTFTDYTENGFKTATENIDTFKSALQSLNDDGYVSAETMWKLIEMDSSLSDSFVKVAGGFRISSDKIIDSKDELIKKELEYTESEANTSKEILTNLKLRLQAIQKQKEIEKQYLENNGANSAWDVNRLKQYDYEINQIEDSISEVESISKKWNLAISQIKSDLGDTVSIADKLKKQSEEIENNIDKIQDRIDSLNDDIEDLKDKQEELLKYQEYQIDKIVDKLEDEQKILEDEKTALEEQLEIIENQKSEIEEQIKIYEDIVSIVEDAINDEKSAIEKEKDLVQSEKEELQKQLDILEDKKASIEDSIQDYEKIYSLVSDIIDKETESIEKERDVVESYYDDMISKLQEENDERERAIELAEKEAALENAKRNKVRVYNEQKGWTWAEDTKAIKKAQDELDKFNNQIKIENLEKEKEQKLKEFDDKISAIKTYGEQFTNGQQNYENNQTYILAEKLLGMSREEIYEKIANQDADFVKQLNETYDKIQETRDGDIQSEIDYINQQIEEKDNQIEVYEEMIDEWDRYIEEWQNTVTEYKKNQDKLIAEQKIGSDWLEKVKRKDTDILTDFKNNYNSYQKALNGTITQEITDLKDSIQAKENEIESKKKQIEEWNTYKEELNQYVNDVSQTWSDYIKGLGDIALNENSTYIDRCKNLTDFKNEYLRLTGEIIDKQGELSSATYELESAKARLEDVKTQLELSDNAYNEAVYNQIDTMSAEYRGLGSQWRYYEPMASSGDPVAAAKINAIASQMYALKAPLRELCEKVGVDFDSITQYDAGGVNTSTGLAWLDGTPIKPELVLNNTDASKLYNLLHTLSVDQLKQKFHFDTFSNPPKSLNAMANNTSAVNNNNNNQNIVLNFYGNIQTNNPVDFMQQMNKYIQQNKLNGRINY